MADIAALRAMALALPEAAEAPHHGAASFRVGGKIFATVPDPATVNMMLEPEQADAAIVLAPEALARLFWGERIAGASAALARIDDALLAALLALAWERKAPAALRKAWRATGADAALRGFPGRP